ncbi:MAG: transposase [Alphaproteobacteria bacterium]|nr:transposase [Alphaproteobacteria bacterium]
MNGIRLGRLPDRSLVRITIAVSPDLHRALEAYSDFYALAYGRKEPLADLIPAMLAGYMEGDRAFVRSRRAESS